MVAFIIRRVVSAILLGFVVTAVTYSLIFSNGPGIARAVLGKDATQSAVEAKAKALGLDQPVIAQYGHWLADLVHGSLGNSYYTNESVTDMLGNRTPVTLSLAIAILVLTAIFSVLIGVAAAWYRGWIDRILQLLTVIGAAIPGFVIAVFLVFLFSIALAWLPATGYISPDQSVSGWALGLVLPVISVLVGSVGGAAQLFRSTVDDVLQQDFVRTLRSRGLSERRIIFGHVLRSAAGPGLTILGLQTIGLLGGIVLIERVFALPGVGDLTVDSALHGDIPVVMGCVVFTVVVVIVVNLLADLAAAWLNPKVRVA